METENKTAEQETVKKKRFKWSTLVKSLAIATITFSLVYVMLYLLIVVLPVRKVDKVYKEQTKLLQEIIDRTEKPEVLKTNEQLQAMTDDELFALISELSDDNKTILEEFEGSFEKFASGWISEFDTDLKYSQLVSLAEYTKAYCETQDLTKYNLTGIFADYTSNMTAVIFFNKAAAAIDALYEDYYSTYSEIESHLDVTSPLQLTGLVNKMVADEELKSTLLGKSTAINRVIQAVYTNLKDDYMSKFGDSDMIQGLFFDVNAKSVEDLVELRMLACDTYTINGNYIPLNISEEDSALIKEARQKARETLVDCNIRFNMTADGDKVNFFEKFCQNFALLSADKVYDRLADYNVMELNSYLHSPLEFTEAQTVKYTRDYVFWNIMLNIIDFRTSTSRGTPTANINYKACTIDYGFIEGGNFMIEDSELDSLLWATAEQSVLSLIYDRCKLTIDDSGNVVAEETNDALVAGFRNLFEAWNLWGAQYSE